MSARAELGTLEASGLIEIAALQPELEYLFRHALVQEAAYATLLKQDRRLLHRAAAETIIALHPDRQRELAAVIGMHYELAGDAPLAAAHLLVAGEHANERFARKEALAFFTRAYDLASDSQGEVRLRAAIGGAKAGWGYSEQVDFIDRLQHALETAGSAADKGLVAEGYSWAAYLLRQRGEVPESSPALKHAIEQVAAIGGTLEDPAAAALPKALMGAFTALTGRLREGAQDMLEALDVIEAKGDPVSSAMVSDFLVMTYARLGEFKAAEDMIVRSERLADTGDTIARIDVEIAQSVLGLERGDVKAASLKAHECATRAEDAGAYACAVVSNLMYGAATMAQDDAPEAKPALERGSELCKVTNMAPMQTLTRALLGSALAQLGDLPGGVGEWDAALAGAREMKDRFGEAQTLWGRARSMRRQPAPEWDAALADLDHAIELFESMETRPSLARALRDRADILRQVGRSEEAAEADRRAGDLARELGLKDLAPA